MIRQARTSRSEIYLVQMLREFASAPGLADEVQSSTFASPRTVENIKMVPIKQL
jgi:hypothetical protein